MLRIQLLDAFDPSLFGGKDVVAISGEKDAEPRSGAFEVFVEEKLLHSKLNGDGFVDNHDKLDELVAEIENLGTE